MHIGGKLWCLKYELHRLLLSWTATELSRDGSGNGTCRSTTHSRCGKEFIQHISNLNTFLSLWMRVQCETNASVKDRTNDELQSILRCLVLPEQCYHSLIENHFENPHRSDTKDGCGDQCSYCDGSYRNFGARVSKSQLIAVLTTHVFSKGLVPAMSLISRISSKENKQI